jgi:hypothetical protein
VGDSTIKHKHWLNLVEEKLANTVKQSKEVGIRHGVPVRVLEALHHLMQPNGYIYVLLRSVLVINYENQSKTQLHACLFYCIQQ